MNRDITIYSIAGTIETCITHPIEVIRTRYVNRTPIWRGIRGIYPGISIQLIGFVPERILFIGTKDVAKRNGYHWWEYSPIVSLLQTSIAAPFVSWKTARIEGIPLTIKPNGCIPLYLRNTIFATCLFASKDEIHNCPSTLSTIVGVWSGVILSHPLDVIRVMKQSKFRNNSYTDLWMWLNHTGSKEGYIRTLWRGCTGRLIIACIGITTMIESMEYLKHVI